MYHIYFQIKILGLEYIVIQKSYGEYMFYSIFFVIEC